MNSYTVTLEQEVVVTRRHTIVVQAENDDDAETTAYDRIGDDGNIVVDTHEAPEPSRLIKAELTPELKPGAATETAAPSLVSELLSDREVRDWHLSEMSESEWNGPQSHRDTYRLKVEQTGNSGQLFFSLYPASLDRLEDAPFNGLSGCIEIRNGRPAISLGLQPDDHPLHVESDIHTGLFVHNDDNCHPVHSDFSSFDHGAKFSGFYYDCAEKNWLADTRRQIAEVRIADALYNTDVEERGSWEVHGDQWSQIVFCVDSEGGSSVSKLYRLDFHPDSTMVQEEDLGETL